MDEKIAFKIGEYGQLRIEYGNSEGGILYINNWQHDEKEINSWSMTSMNGNGLGFSSYPKDKEEITSHISDCKWISYTYKARLQEVINSIEY